MKHFSQSLLEEMDTKLREVHSENSELLTRSSQAMRMLIPILERLKSFSVNYRFSNTKEEIDFFRNIKPAFSSKLIFYNEIYAMELNKPVCRSNELRKYYKAKSAKLKSFFEENSEFYRYYRSGSQELDRLYFVRGRYTIQITLDSAYFQADNRFATARDYDVARILANQMLLNHIETILKPVNVVNPGYTLKWTASKVALVELIYALHAQGTFNNGQLDLRELVIFFESNLSIDLGQYHKTFLEIRERKSDRVKFIASLKETLIQRMEQADEN